MSKEDVEKLSISDTAKQNLMVIFEANGCFDQKQGVERAIDFFKTKQRLEAARKTENKPLKLTFDEAISHKSLAEIKENRKAAIKYESTRQPKTKIKLTFEEGASGKSIDQILRDRKTRIEASRKRLRPQSFLFGKR